MEPSIGVTGTQMGCDRAQLDSLRGWLGTLYIAGFHWMENGDCIGVDAESARSWQAMGGFISLRPCTIRNKRAFIQANRVYTPKPPLVRNKDIVDHATVMVAAPASMVEELRSGTWATIRYARRSGKPLVICWPDGLVTTENGAAQAIEARRAETGTGSVHESAVRQDAPNA